MAKWLSIQDVAKQSGKSERTLRAYAAQGKIKAEKDGKGWMCEKSSLKKAGIVLAEDTALPIVAEKAAALPRQSGKSAAKTETTKTTKKKRVYQTLDDLGVYRDLVDLWFDYTLEELDGVSGWIQITMEHIALGFYEYSPEKKALFFRSAREGLVKAIVGIKIQNKKKKDQYKDCIASLEAEILSGIIGLIRSAEKRADGTARPKTTTRAATSK